MKKLIITGAAGFIGRHCLPLLSSRGYDIHAFDLSKIDGLYPGITWHQIDLFDTLNVSRLISRIKPTHLLHLAWTTEHGKFWQAPDNIRWVEISIKILDQFWQSGGKRVLGVGTCAEYDWQYGFCSEDLTPLVPANLYGACKNAWQNILFAFGQQNGISAAWGRIFFLYGPFEDPHRLIPSVIRALLKNEPIKLTHGEQIRDYLFVTDVASALVTLLDSDSKGNFNISSGDPIRLKTIVNAIGEHLDGRGLLLFNQLPAQENDPHLLVGNNYRLRQEMNWLPQVDLNSGLQQTINWWKNHLT